MASRINIESIRDDKIDTLNDLIEITRDNAKFYSEAATKVENPQLRTLFTRMADSKQNLVGKLATDVRSEGATPSTGGTMRGKLQEFYTDVRSHLADNGYSYVKGLEAAEDRLLKAFDNVIKDNNVSSPVKQVVNEYLPTIRQQHDLMRDRKWEMQQTRN